MRQNSKGQEQLGLWDTRREQHLASERPTDKAPALPAHRPSRPVEYQELWTIEDASAYSECPSRRSTRGRTTGYGQKGIRIGKHLRWRAATVITWTFGLEETQ